jgi:hypothetical protein
VTAYVVAWPLGRGRLTDLIAACRQASLWESRLRHVPSPRRMRTRSAERRDDRPEPVPLDLAAVNSHRSSHGQNGRRDLELRMCCDVSDSLVLARAFSDLLGAGQQRGVDLASSSADFALCESPHLQAILDGP